ncbi:hypothetical protein [Pseudodesulfovibrio sp.]|uniref:hypothetical protein n=1 Tax=Pseudodesulfovibrio sp. TaxID=2035812 RepID=UPI0026228211|nr:hypothetical protein [Pseudodesulfovibrio sp.]MDD3311452.1 hypothetical protein [Pseudodesulfovibrio sp.]
MKKTGLTFIFLLTLFASNSYGYMGVIQAAHNAGFTHCDIAIKKEFSDFFKADDSRYNISWTERGFNITCTYGSPGDTVFQSVTFIDTGKKVTTFSTATIQSPMSPAQYMQKYSAWKYQAIQGGTTWAANEGGVICIITSLPQGGIIVQFYRSGEYQRN